VYFTNIDMELSFSKVRCFCARPGIPLSSALLFLSIILPSYAQVTNSPPSVPTSTNSLTSSSRPPRTSHSTTFSTSSAPRSTPPQPTILRPPDPSVSSPSDSNDLNTPATQTFNYYFLIIAVVAVIFCLGVLYFGRRRRRKQALLRSSGRHALARDVEGWRGRFGVGRIGGSSNHIHRIGREEGLDDRGEAPPPYVPGSKPPSIRTHDGRRPSTSSRHQDMELESMMRDGIRLPDYHEHADLRSGEDITDVRRPETAITASERFGSTGRLMSNTGSSS